MLLLALIILVLNPVLVQAQNNTSTNGTDTQCPVDIPGFFHRGDCKLLCRPARWTDILVFYLGNYIAHAATVISRPGQSTLSSFGTILSALLFPGVGLVNGMHAIFSLAKLAPTDLQVAARSGALCAVVRVPEWNPPTMAADNTTPDRPDSPDIHGQNGGQSGDLEMQRFSGIANSTDGIAVIGEQVGNDTFNQDHEHRSFLRPLQERQEPAKLFATKVHGRCQLPKGYELMVVPKTASFEADDVATVSMPNAYLGNTIAAMFKSDPNLNTTISCNYNFVKVCISIIQLLFATSTVYHTRGDQIELYGYAAFGLTVAPYAWMSLVNLTGNLLCPNYDTMFIVGSSALDELEDRLRLGTVQDKERFAVKGLVGRLTTHADKEMRQHYFRVVSTNRLWEGILASLTELANIMESRNFDRGRGIDAGKILEDSLAYFTELISRLKHMNGRISQANNPSDEILDHLAKLPERFRKIPDDIRLIVAMSATDSNMESLIKVASRIRGVIAAIIQEKHAPSVLVDAGGALSRYNAAYSQAVFALLWQAAATKRDNTLRAICTIKDILIHLPSRSDTDIVEMIRPAETEIPSMITTVTRGLIALDILALPDPRRSRIFIMNLVVIISATVPIIIIGALSQFQAGQSAIYQRVWIMMWIVFGIIVALGSGPLGDRLEGRPLIGSTARWDDRDDYAHIHPVIRKLYRLQTPWLLELLGILVYAAIPVGGYVVVAEMISSFGTCLELNGDNSGI